MGCTPLRNARKGVRESRNKSCRGSNGRLQAGLRAGESWWTLGCRKQGIGCWAQSSLCCVRSPMPEGRHAAWRRSGGGYAHTGFQHQGHDNADAYGYRSGEAPMATAMSTSRKARAAAMEDTTQPGAWVGLTTLTAPIIVRTITATTGVTVSFQYAGAITPVSAETRSVPRPPEDESMVRAGSIRADVARYNEERGSSRPPPRPPEYMSRPPGPSPYRN